MRIVLLACLLAFHMPADEAAIHTPQLLLSPRLLRRLKRDRERQTVRWVAFENRVKTVPDSPERGLELALYYAVSGDGNRAKEALAWAANHPCERRQRALIQDWVGAVPPLPCSAPASLRDQAFEKIAAGGDPSDIADLARATLLPKLAANGVTSSADLYATLELLSVLRDKNGADIRSADPAFFRNLPLEFLLALKPDQIEKPNWITHVAALALVTVDPNLEASQFLQGWAMEDRQTLKEGPGVAYELLWADPYLPGIAYQNLDPWVYNPEAGRLFARSNWNADACWISISKNGVQDLNCPRGWRDQPVQFGSMTLIPMTAKCIEIPHTSVRESIMVWRLEPDQTVVFGAKKENKEQADASGLWHPGSNVTGKVCLR